MNPIEIFLRYISSPTFAESVFSGVAGNVAHEALKPAIEKIRRQLTGSPASEVDLNGAMEELIEHIVQIGVHTNLNIN